MPPSLKRATTWANLRVQQMASSRLRAAQLIRDRHVSELAIEEQLLVTLRKEHNDRTHEEIDMLNAWLERVRFPPTIRAALNFELLMHTLRVLPTTLADKVVTTQGEPDGSLYIVLHGQCACTV